MPKLPLGNAYKLFISCKMTLVMCLRLFYPTYATPQPFPSLYGCTWVVLGISISVKVLLLSTADHARAYRLLSHMDSDGDGDKPSKEAEAGPSEPSSQLSLSAQPKSLRCDEWVVVTCWLIKSFTVDAAVASCWEVNWMLRWAMHTTRSVVKYHNCGEESFMGRLLPRCSVQKE